MPILRLVSSLYRKRTALLGCLFEYEPRLWNPVSCCGLHFRVVRQMQQLTSRMLPYFQRLGQSAGCIADSFSCYPYSSKSPHFLPVVVSLMPDCSNMVMLMLLTQLLPSHTGRRNP